MHLKKKGVNVFTRKLIRWCVRESRGRYPAEGRKGETSKREIEERNGVDKSYIPLKGNGLHRLAVLIIK